MNVAVLHEALVGDARADESDVLVQAAAVERALGELGHEHRTVTFAGDLDATVREMKALRADVVFNLVETVGGSCRDADMVPEALAGAGLPFTGSGAAATRLTASKLDTKQHLLALGLATPRFATLETLLDGAHLPRTRWLVKSVWEHGSVGLEDDCVVVVAGAGQLRDEIRQRRGRMGGEAFAEAYVHGREFNLAMLARDGGVEHLPAAEILFAEPSGSPRIVGYKAKWSPGSQEDVATPRSFAIAGEDEPLVARMRGMAGEVWRSFGLRGYARVDLRVDDAGEPWIIDVNTNPCLSPDAGFAAALARAGISWSAAVARILAAAVPAAG